MEERMDYKTLIDAVKRYVTNTTFPDLDTVLLILGIENQKENEKRDEADV